MRALYVTHAQADLIGDALAFYVDEKLAQPSEISPIVKEIDTPEINDGGAAFPAEGGLDSGLHPTPGMTMRQFYAASALMAVMKPFTEEECRARMKVGQEPIDAMIEVALKAADRLIFAESGQRLDKMRWAYLNLASGIQDMIDREIISEETAPDDFQWLEQAMDDAVDHDAELAKIINERREGEL